ncbi:MAG: hypothetical protein ACO1NU_08580 [Arcticibacter sp.]
MQSAYDIYKNEIGVRMSFLISDFDKRQKDSLAIIGYDAIAKRAKRNPGLRLREGKGLGNEALLSWVNLPYDWKKQCIERFGDPDLVTKTNELEKLYQIDPKAADVYATFKKGDGTKLDPKLIKAYTANASVLNAVIVAVSKRKSYRKALGGAAKSFWDIIADEVEDLREKTGHTLKTASLRKLVASYKKNGYESLISGKLGNQTAAKIVTGDHVALIEELLKKHTNLDNEQIRSLYNMAASRIGWKTISAGTVAKYRKELDLYTYSGRRGETNHRNNRAMQVKRKAPNVPMVYWSIDGWDAELLYQKTEINSKGNSVTSYHNRLTVVVVLDPCGNYPIGHAIGTHETPELIKEALRDAANHTRELFGARYKTLQLQSDHYGKGVLVPTYEAMTKHYTPARVKNAKTKRVERYFLDINKQYCQLYYKNWSGFGITSNKENQPNQDYLNKIRHQFPDEAGCRQQISTIIEMERFKKREEYVSRWYQMPDADHLPLTDEEYLNLFGIHTGFTNRLEGSGLNPTILGEKRCYDSFDIRFREMKTTDWLVKYDPSDLSRVLIVNAESRNGKLVKEINTVSFILEAKYVQPMALYDRKDGDALQLQRVDHYNKQLEEAIIFRGVENRRKLEDLFVSNPQLNDTLTKLVLTDSLGQHKDNRNNSRLLKSASSLERKLNRIEVKESKDQHTAMREAYIDEKINIDDFLKP